MHEVCGKAKRKKKRVLPFTKEGSGYERKHSKRA